MRMQNAMCSVYIEYAYAGNRLRSATRIRILAVLLVADELYDDFVFHSSDTPLFYVSHMYIHIQHPVRSIEYHNIVKVVVVGVE